MEQQLRSRPLITSNHVRGETWMLINH